MCVRPYILLGTTRVISYSPKHMEIYILSRSPLLKSTWAHRGVLERPKGTLDSIALGARRGTPMSIMAKRQAQDRRSAAPIRWNRNFFFSFLPPYKLLGTTGVLCTVRGNLQCVFFFVCLPIYNTWRDRGVFYWWKETFDFLDARQGTSLAITAKRASTDRR